MAYEKGRDERTYKNQTVLCLILTEQYLSVLVESAHVPIKVIKSFGLPCLFSNVLREISVEMDKA